METDTHRVVPANKSTETEKEISRGDVVLAMENTESFDDPEGYFRITIPGGYDLEDKSSPGRSKFIFKYAENATLAILAHPITKQLNPKAEMKKRVAATKSVKAGALSKAENIRAHLISIGGADGFELVFDMGPSLCHSFSLVSPARNAVTLSIVADGKNRKKLHGLLEEAVINRLTF